MWTQTDRRLGIWSASTSAVAGIVFVFVGFVGVLKRPPSAAFLLQQVDPYLAILESLIILFAVALVVMMSAVYAYTSPENKSSGLAAMAFTLAFAVVTLSTHFVSLTVGRQLPRESIPLLSRQLFLVEWPTVALALDLLAWDFLLGLALLFTAPVFHDGHLQNAIRLATYSAGALCLVGTLGPLSGHMWLQFPAIIGYGFVLPLICALVAVLFARSVGAPTSTPFGNHRG